MYTNYTNTDDKLTFADGERSLSSMSASAPVSSKHDHQKLECSTFNDWTLSSSQNAQNFRDPLVSLSPSNLSAASSEDEFFDARSELNNDEFFDARSEFSNDIASDNESEYFDSLSELPVTIPTENQTENQTLWSRILNKSRYGVDYCARFALLFLPESKDIENWQEPTDTSSTTVARAIATPTTRAIAPRSMPLPALPAVAPTPAVKRVRRAVPAQLRPAAVRAQPKSEAIINTANLDEITSKLIIRCKDGSGTFRRVNIKPKPSAPKIVEIPAESVKTKLTKKSSKHKKRPQQLLDKIQRSKSVMKATIHFQQMRQRVNKKICELRSDNDPLDLLDDSKLYGNVGAFEKSMCHYANKFRKTGFCKYILLAEESLSESIDWIIFGNPVKIRFSVRSVISVCLCITTIALSFNSWLCWWAFAIPLATMVLMWIPKLVEFSISYCKDIGKSYVSKNVASFDMSRANNEFENNFVYKHSKDSKLSELYDMYTNFAQEINKSEGGSEILKAHQNFRAMLPSSKNPNFARCLSELAQAILESELNTMLFNLSESIVQKIKSHHWIREEEMNKIDSILEKMFNTII